MQVANMKKTYQMMNEHLNSPKMIRILHALATFSIVGLVIQVLVMAKSISPRRLLIIGIF